MRINVINVLHGKNWPVESVGCQGTLGSGGLLQVSPDGLIRGEAGTAPDLRPLLSENHLSALPAASAFLRRH